MRESTIEKAVSAYARQKGWLVYKFTSPNHRGVPDKIFMKDQICFFIEFKATGKKPTKLQLVTHKKFEKQGFHVFVIDSVNDGVKVLDAMESC